jgi:hypothetical protein
MQHVGLHLLNFSNLPENNWHAPADPIDDESLVDGYLALCYQRLMLTSVSARLDAFCACENVPSLRQYLPCQTNWTN